MHNSVFAAIELLVSTLRTLFYDSWQVENAKTQPAVESPLEFLG